MENFLEDVMKREIRHVYLNFLKKNKITNIFLFFIKLWEKKENLCKKKINLFPLFQAIELFLKKNRLDIMEYMELRKKYVKYEEIKSLSEETKERYKNLFIEDFLRDARITTLKVERSFDYGMSEEGELRTLVCLETNKRVYISTVDLINYVAKKRKEIEEIEELILTVCVQYVRIQYIGDKK